MRIFITGATGWVGSAVVKEMVSNGHEITGLARSIDKAGALAATGAEVLLGTLDDLETLRRAASTADAVIHTAFNHDFSRFAENAQQDRCAIEALGGALEGTEKPLVVTSGVALLAPGRVATEADLPRPIRPTLVNRKRPPKLWQRAACVPRRSGWRHPSMVSAIMDSFRC